MTELELDVNESDYWRLKEAATQRYELPDKVTFQEYPVDFDRVRFNFGGRRVIRDFEGVTGRTLFIGDKILR